MTSRACGSAAIFIGTGLIIFEIDMSRITFTKQERELFAPLFIRKFQILKKISSLIGSGNMAENASLNLDDFIGKGFDDRDVRRIASLVSAMKNVVRKVRVGDDFLQVAFFPHALSLVAKLASQAEEAEPQGNGVLFCEAALALKRALGVRGDVEYTQDFDFENFNHGEDVAYLDTAFEGDGWRMEFQGRIQERIRLNRRIEILAWKEASGFSSMSLLAVLILRRRLLPGL